MVGTGNLTSLSIHRPAKTDANTNDVTFPSQIIGQCAFDLIAYALRTGCSIYFESLAVSDLPLAITKHNLQLGPSNFDTDEQLVHFENKCMGFDES
jgi:hypothetical protein